VKVGPLEAPGHVAPLEATLERALPALHDVLHVDPVQKGARVAEMDFGIKGKAALRPGQPPDARTLKLSRRRGQAKLVQAPEPAALFVDALGGQPALRTSV